MAENYFDVIIAGAGPAGTTCALALKDSGLKVGLLDKANFPRDKVCGDAIPGRSVKVLGEMDAGYAKAFEKLYPKMEIKTTRVVTSKNKEANIHWKLKAYNSTRYCFDEFLFNLVKQYTGTIILENTKINAIETHADHQLLKTNTGDITCGMLVGCDGAHSIVAKRLAGFEVDRDHYLGSVRSYYTGISESREMVNEIFFSKKYLPGYFWVFPVAQDLYNVGFGMLSSTISKKKINLSTAMYDVIEEFPELKRRFEPANASSKQEGFGLPIGTRQLPISGDRYLLCGDAASLIDPISGEGIGNSMMSGLYAARHIMANKGSAFTASVNKSYDKMIYKRLGAELKRSTRILRLCSRFPVLLDVGVFLLSDRFPFSRHVQKMI